MNYARKTDKTFSTLKGVVRTKTLSPEVASRRQYIASHTFSVDINALTKEANVKVERKHAE